MLLKVEITNSQNSCYAEKRGKEERGGEEECFQRLQVQEKVYRGSFPNLYKHLVRTIH